MNWLARKLLLTTTIMMVFVPWSAAIGASPSLDPTWTELMRDDFSSALHPSWDFSGGLVRLGGAGVETLILGEGGAMHALAGSPDWQDYALQVRFRLTTTTEFGVAVRQGHTTYASSSKHVEPIMLNVHGDSQGLQISSNALCNLLTPCEQSKPVPGSGWYELVIVVEGGRVRLAVNDQLVFDQDLSSVSPPTHGNFSIDWVSGGDLEIDTVTVTGKKPESAWVRLSAPKGVGRVARVRPHPTNTQVIAVQGVHSGVWITRDGGSTWKLELTGLNNVDISGLHRNPLKPEVLLVGNGDARWYYSHDDGKTWHNTVTVGTKSAQIGAGPVAFSASATERVYMGVGGVGCILRSDDNGKSFQAISDSQTTCNGSISAIAVTVDQGVEQIWIGTTDKGLGRSVDGGKTWSFSAQISDQVTSFLSYEADGKRHLWVATQASLFHSINGTASELAQVTFEKAEMPGGRQVLRLADGTLVVASEGEFYVSKDEGKTFDGFAFQLVNGVSHLAVDNANTGSLLVGGEGIFRLNLTSNTLTDLGQDLASIGILSLATDPQAPSIVWAGTWGKGGLARSLDYGKTWSWVFPRDKSCTLGQCQEHEYSMGGYPLIRINPTNGCHILAAGPLPGIVVSRDRGQTWKNVTQANGLTSDTITDIEFHPKNPKLVYLTAGCLLKYFTSSDTCETDPQGLYRSDDGGDSFVRVGAPADHGQLTTVAVDPTHTDRLWVGTYDAGIWLSEDGGKSFVRVGKDTLGLDYVLDIAVDPQTPTRLYAIGNSYYYNSWKFIGKDPGDESTFPQYPEGFYVSEDGGKTWTATNHSGNGPEFIVLHPSKPGTVFVGSHSYGVWRTQDYGKNWLPFSEGMLYLQNNTRGGHNYTFAMSISNDGNVLYAGSCGRGVFRHGTPGTGLDQLPPCGTTTNGDVQGPDGDTPDVQTPGGDALGDTGKGASPGGGCQTAVAADAAEGSKAPFAALLLFLIVCGAVVRRRRSR